MLDIGTWWRKHLRLPIWDRERGLIIYLTIDSKPNPNSCSFFLLRPTEWRRTVSLWPWTSFVIGRQMWGETRGRWEGLPVGKFLEQVPKFWFFCIFPATYRFRNFGFSRGFPWFLGEPKNSQNADFSAVSRDFEGRARPKNPRGFSLDEQGSKSGFSCGVLQFLGDPKNSRNAVFLAVSWDFKGWACPNFFGTWTSPQFSRDFEVSDPLKKLLNPQTYLRFFSGIRSNGPTQKI
jgi:hypothetical protein